MDNMFLISLLGMRLEKHFWIGLSNRNHLDYFIWTNKVPVTFTHWNHGMPGVGKKGINLIKSAIKLTLTIYNSLCPV